MTTGLVLQGVNHEAGLPMAIVLSSGLVVRYTSVQPRQQSIFSLFLLVLVLTCQELTLLCSPIT